MYDQNHLLFRLSAAGDPAGVFARRPGLPDVSYRQLFDGAEAMAISSSGISLRGLRMARVSCTL